jgi:hypothetical protein
MRKRIKALATLAITSASFGVAIGGQAAQAGQLTNRTPDREGELALTNISCIVGEANCINPEDYGLRITSLAYDLDNINPQFGLSRLFVDDNTTENKYVTENQKDSNGNPIGYNISFGTKDAGTNPTHIWLRPVAFANAKSADSSPINTKDNQVNTLENGQLEVGSYLVELLRPVNEVSLDFFDTEDSNFTGVLAVNGQKYDGPLLQAGKNSNVQNITFKDNDFGGPLRSFIVQLGKPGPNSVFQNTGDGVRLRLATRNNNLLSAKAPEPGTIAGMAALATVGLLNSRRRKKVSV